MLCRVVILRDGIMHQDFHSWHIDSFSVALITNLYLLTFYKPAFILSNVAISSLFLIG